MVACPLRVCVGASNAIPDDPALAAFADRFLVRVFVESVTDARLDELLEVGWAARPAERRAGEHIMTAVDRLADVARACDLSPVQPVISARRFGGCETPGSI